MFFNVLEHKLMFRWMLSSDPEHKNPKIANPKDRFAQLNAIKVREEVTQKRNNKMGIVR
jgi:hypothetical protein